MAGITLMPPPRMNSLDSATWAESASSMVTRIWLGEWVKSLTLAP